MLAQTWLNDDFCFPFFGLMLSKVTHPIQADVNANICQAVGSVPQPYNCMSGPYGFFWELAF